MCVCVCVCRSGVCVKVYACIPWNRPASGPLGTMTAAKVVHQLHQLHQLRRRRLNAIGFCVSAARCSSRTCGSCRSLASTSGRAILHGRFRLLPSCGTTSASIASSLSSTADISDATLARLHPRLLSCIITGTCARAC